MKKGENIMTNHSFLTYSEVTNNDIHKGYSIDIHDLLLSEIKEAIDMKVWLKEHQLTLNEKDLKWIQMCYFYLIH